MVGEQGDDEENDLTWTLHTCKLFIDCLNQQYLN